MAKYVPELDDIEAKEDSSTLAIAPSPMPSPSNRHGS
jgi:hypothetical protein